MGRWGRFAGILLFLLVTCGAVRADETEYHSYCAVTLGMMVADYPDLAHYPASPLFDYIAAGIVPERKAFENHYGSHHPGATAPERRIARIVELYRELMRKAQAHNDTKDFMKEEELRDIAEVELREIEAALARGAPDLRDEMISHLYPQNKAPSAIIEIDTGGGSGATKAPELVRQLTTLYSTIADGRGWSVKILSEEYTASGNPKNIRIEVTGPGAYAFFKHEAGRHQVEFKERGRKLSNDITVAVLPASERPELKLDEADLEVTTTTSQGPGGQHVNKTQSAVRLVHKPTGEMVFVQSQRSQHLNLQEAKRLMALKLEARAKEQAAAAHRDQKREQIGTGQRRETPKIRTYDLIGHRVTDHRTKDKITLPGDDVVVARVETLFERLENYFLGQLLRTEPAGTPPS